MISRVSSHVTGGICTDLCVRPGFMLFMLGCMGTFPCGSFCLLFWWRSRRRRPSSSHHDDSRAARETHGHTYAETLGRTAGHRESRSECAVKIISVSWNHSVRWINDKWLTLRCSLTVNQATFKILKGAAFVKKKKPPRTIASVDFPSPTSHHVYLQCEIHTEIYLTLRTSQFFCHRERERLKWSMQSIEKHSDKACWSNLCRKEGHHGDTFKDLGFLNYKQSLLFFYYSLHAPWSLWGLRLITLCRLLIWVIKTLEQQHCKQMMFFLQAISDPIFTFPQTVNQVVSLEVSGCTKLLLFEQTQFQTMVQSIH